MNEATSAVEVTENDIPGAILHEPLGNVTVHFSFLFMYLCAMYIVNVAQRTFAKIEITQTWR